MSIDPVLAATYWKSNAYLIEDCARLGYLRDTDVILDPTHGRGIWWQRWRPEKGELVTRSRETSREWDFRAMPYEDRKFDAVAYDPPYVSVGGRTTTGIPDMHAHYGLTDAPKTPALLQLLINEGMDECARVLKPNGVLLVKCQSYISSGKLFPGEYNTYNHASLLELTLVDRFVHLTKPRPQPERERQMHSRNNYSVLFVFRKPKA